MSVMGQRIANSRRQAGLSQKQAAKLLNMHYRRLQKMEDGKFNPTMNEIGHMTTVFEVSEAYLRNGNYGTMLDELAEHVDAPEAIRLDVMRKWGAHIDYRK